MDYQARSSLAAHKNELWLWNKHTQQTAKNTDIVGDSYQAVLSEQRIMRDPTALSRMINI